MIGYQDTGNLVAVPTDRAVIPEQERRTMHGLPDFGDGRTKNGVYMHRKFRIILFMPFARGMIPTEVRIIWLI